MNDKIQARRDEEKRRKRSHFINILYVLLDQGITEASARTIAKHSDLYSYNGTLIDYLNGLADEGYLRMEVYAYRKAGPCSHRYTYSLPDKEPKNRSKKHVSQKR